MNTLRIADELWPQAAPSYPMDDYLAEGWEEYDFASFASTLGLSPMMGEGLSYGGDCSAWRLGDSDVVVAVTWTRQQGEAGRAQFARYCHDLADAMSLALDTMSADYANVYDHMLDDIATNGVNMPFNDGMVEPYDPRTR